MNNKVVQQMSLSALIIAIIAIMTFVPYVGYISAGAVSICTIHIIVLLCGLLFGWKQGLVAGFAFGIFSLIKAAAMPSSPNDVLFINPLISLLPRMVFGALSGLVFSLIKKIEDLGARTVLYVIFSILLTLFHSALVLTMLYLFSRNSFGDNFVNVMIVLLSINTLIETISAAILVPALSIPIGKAIPKFNPYARHISVND